MIEKPAPAARRFRFHGGGLADAIAASLVFSDAADLERQVRTHGELEADEELRSEEYCGDEMRTGWRDVQIVISTRGYVVGYCEGPL